MAFGDLTPVERKNKYYATVQLGKDVKTQTELLKTQAKAMIAAQCSSTNSIVASQATIRDGMDNLAYSIDDVKEGMYGLKAAFDYSISEVVWQIEQNRQSLKSILEVLIAPLDTQAKELRRRAEEAYASGWYDDALDDFLESEKKNKYDFSVHTSIGIIYLFQVVDYEKALEYFEKAIKYAKPKSKYHASFALLHAAFIKREANLLDQAEKLTAEAIELSPNFAEALYQNAQYNVLLNNPNEALPRLEMAIKLDKNYCLKADNDIIFDKIRERLNGLFSKLRDNQIQDLKRFLNNSTSLFERLGASTGLNSQNVSTIQSIIQKIELYICRNTYFDALAAMEPLQVLQDKLKLYRDEIRNHLSSKSNSLDKQITAADAEDKYNSERFDRFFDGFTDFFIDEYPFGGFVLLAIVFCFFRYLLKIKTNISVFLTLALVFIFFGIGIWSTYRKKTPSESKEVSRLRSEKAAIDRLLGDLIRF